MAVAEAKKQIILLETKNYEVVTKDWTYHNARITSLDFSSDNSFLMSTGLDNFVYFWNIESLKKEA